MSLDLLPVEPIVEGAIRHGSGTLSGSARDAFLLAGFLWSLYKWERQKAHGVRRDAKDREQDLRLLKLEKVNQSIPMAEYIHSPNYGRRGTRSVRYIVVHSMAGPMQSAINEFLRPNKEKSAHYLIGHDGRVVQMVQEHNAAWHAGSWKRPFTNADSIGIEHEGGTYNGQTIMLGEDGYIASSKLIASLHFKYNLGEPSNKTVVPHKGVAATACPSGLDVDKLISMSIQEYRAINSPVVTVQEPPTVIHVPIRMEGRTTSALNVRVSPDTQKPALRTMAKNQGYWFIGTVEGEKIKDNSTWLILEDNNYVWSGATNYKKS